MERKLFATACCLDAQIRYYLLAEAERYGVGLEYRGEEIALSGLTTIRHQAEGLLEAMARGRVTPVTACDIAEDWIRAGEW